jgi:hypothetical protein
MGARRFETNGLTEKTQWGFSKWFT